MSTDRIILRLTVLAELAEETAEKLTNQLSKMKDMINELRNQQTPVLFEED